MERLSIDGRHGATGRGVAGVFALVVAMMGTGRLLSNIQLSSLVFDFYVVSTLRAHDSYWDDAAGPIHRAARPEGKVKHLACFLTDTSGWSPRLPLVLMSASTKQHLPYTCTSGICQDAPWLRGKNCLHYCPPFCHPTDRTSNVTEGSQYLRLSIELHSLEATTSP